MHYREYEPHPSLKRYLKCYWTLEISRPTPQYEWLRFLVEGIELTITLSEEIEFYTCDIKTDRYPHFCVHGPMTRTMHIRPASEVALFGICFRPGGAFPFFPYQISELVDKSIGVYDLWESKRLEVFHRVRNECETTKERINHLDHYLLRQFDIKQDTYLSVAVDVIEANKGQVNIDNLARLIGLSARHLERKFRARVGISPKQFCRNLRFKNILTHRETSPSVSWASTAISCGYYDQSHMINDFRHFTGTNPEIYFANGSLKNDFTF